MDTFAHYIFFLVEDPSEISICGNKGTVLFKSETVF